MPAEASQPETVEEPVERLSAGAEWAEANPLPAEEADETAAVGRETSDAVSADDRIGVSAAPAPNIWQRLRRLFVTQPSDAAGRLAQLTRAIDDTPDSASNYVLRGEIYMEMREYALAYTDFQRAAEVAAAAFEAADWGLLEQALRDRALAGLRKAERRLR